MSPENYENDEMLDYSQPTAYGSLFQLQSSTYKRYLKDGGQI